MRRPNERKTRRWNLLADWRVRCGLLLFAVTLAGAFLAGWDNAFAVFFVAWLGMVVAWAFAVAVQRLTARAAMWFRSTWILCAVLVLALLVSFDTVVPPVLILSIWLVVPVGWSVLFVRRVVAEIRGPAPDEHESSSPSAGGILAMTIAFCPALVVLHLWPGVVHRWDAFPAYALTLGTLALWWVWSLLDLGLARSRRAHLGRRGRRTLLLAFAGMSVIAATWRSLSTGSVRTAGFVHWRERFESIATSAARGAGTGESWKELDRWIGPWHVDAVGRDGGGGVYLRTWRSRDLGLSAPISYGFAYRPDGQRSSFGATFWLEPVCDDWALFCAGEDWD